MAYAIDITLFALVQRDPSKRRVKPVEKHLMQIHFGMSDDDDTDSDYEFKPGAESEDDGGSDDSTGALKEHIEQERQKDLAKGMYKFVSIK